MLRIESKRYQLDAGDNVFVVEVIGGFPWINPNISIDTDVAEVQDDCADVVQPGQSCNLIVTPNPTANNMVGNINAFSALSYTPIAVEVLNEIDKPEVLKIATALMRITLGASKGKVENVDISEFMNSYFIEFSDDLSTCEPDEMGLFTLNDTESYHIFVHQKSASFQRMIRSHIKRLAIKTLKSTYVTEMTYNGYLLLGDSDGDQSSRNNKASVFFYTTEDGQINYAKEKMLTAIVGENINEINQMTANLYGEFYFTDNRGMRKQLYRINFENNQAHKLLNDARSDFWGVATATDHHRISNRDALSTFFLSKSGLVIQEYRYLDNSKSKLLDTESEKGLGGNDYYAAGFFSLL